MKPFLRTKDFSVSGEEFELLLDEDLQMLVTQPQPKDLQKYYESDAYISHTDSRKSTLDKMYHAVKKFSLWNKVNLIGRYAKKNKTLLDVGAGTGDFLLHAQSRGWSVDGVEPSLDARMRSREKKMELVSDLSFVAGNKFQVITLWHVLEHLPDLDNQIKTILSLLETDGVLVVAVPNFKSKDAKFYKGFWAAYDVPRHLWHFSREAIEGKFVSHQMKLIKTRPMWFDSFYVSMLSEKYKTGKQNFIRAFCVGLWSNILALFNGQASSLIYILKKEA
ncbi:class I SAM-dependent methyltransferase [Zobellia galactanivorans]|uniref:class I SAM-dependent methyltransferase n=1 Tax=Zobellia galactanivorans (strain DSM 12802 / CCUG 47099 / CIP 106680 / NCIMB 13871 / Dsij) TaxID=63186 RepID=UPI0026E30E8B|nr:class I SAM-dependent methyltransferase [Zobellia galactanivorans]MDO6809146.1 class I SAM-dependent methyltransferase [Zobellia galactanivorans]